MLCTSARSDLFLNRDQHKNCLYGWLAQKEKKKRKPATLKIKTHCSKHCGQLFQAGETRRCVCVCFMTEENGIPCRMVCFSSILPFRIFLKCSTHYFTLQHIYSLLYLGECACVCVCLKKNKKPAHALSPSCQHVDSDIPLCGLLCMMHIVLKWTPIQTGVSPCAAHEARLSWLLESSYPKACVKIYFTSLFCLGGVQ